MGLARCSKDFGFNTIMIYTKIKVKLLEDHRVLGFPDGSDGNESACNAGDTRDTSSIPESKDPLEKEMATHSSILPGESHGQRSLTGYSPKGHKESDNN